MGCLGKKRVGEGVDIMLVQEVSLSSLSVKS